jgi:hypothetical protein
MLLRLSKVLVIIKSSNNNIKLKNNTKSISPSHRPGASCHRSAPSELESEAAGARLPRTAAGGISSFSTRTLSQLTNRLETESAAAVAISSVLDDTAELKRTFFAGVAVVDSE